jgi:sulfatase modifying factor 1
MKQWMVSMIFQHKNKFILLLIFISSINCKVLHSQENNFVKDTLASCCMKIPSRFSVKHDSTIIHIDSIITTEGMVLIPGGTFNMGGDNEQADRDEFPKHRVTVTSFYMDATEVTNKQFKQFVDATGYITTAERKPDWDELKKSLPPGTPQPPDEVLVAASLVFKVASGPINLNNYSQWWEWVSGADWQHPQGPNSSIIGKENLAVVQVSWDDAMAYCKWAGKRLPTEAEWEYAARGGLKDEIYPWGSEHVNAGKPKANTWEGKFPYLNEKKDGFDGAAPVKSFLPNGYGLYDMAGNVWEWCSDWYKYDYYSDLKDKISDNSQGPANSYDPDEPFAQKRSLRGGSFLCNDSYCSGYRVSRRMKSSPDTGLEHTGFRCVRDITQ